MRTLLRKNSVPEMILFFVGTCLFITNTNIPNRFARILFFLIALLVYAFSKSLITAHVLRTEAVFSRNNQFVSYGFLLIEFGVMLNLYIIGFTGENPLSEIVNYGFGLLKPVAVFLSIVLIFRTMGKYDDYSWKSTSVRSFLISFFLIWGFAIPGSVSAENLGRAFAVPAAEAFLIVISLMMLYSILCSPGTSPLDKLIRRIFSALTRFRYSTLAIVGIHVAFSGLITVLQMAHVFDSQSMLSARVAAVEFLKLSLLSALAAIQCINKAKLCAAENSGTEPDKTTESIEKLRAALHKYQTKSCIRWGTLLFLFFITMIPLIACGEMGTCLILGAMLILISFSSQNNHFGIISMALFALLYMILWKWHVRGVSDSFLGEKLNRLFALDRFTQINDMNDIIDESNVLFQLIPYKVNLVGQLNTRVEDFSYLNIISVFGVLFAGAFMIYLLLIPFSALQFLNAEAERRKNSLSLYDYNLLTISKWPLLLFIANSAVHIISNLGIFIFTGVTLPLVSNGFMNTIVTVVSFVPVIRCLGRAEYEERKNH